ncbi:MAG: cell division protein FtsW [Nitrospirae bacterium GWF2_44_13]|nr:MAG: cell division protein FtsW [Nitrospirae bacterium GWF2_44_13]OGW32893.1 MAG: cell division protein FtsW [Nitrospirae bacterium GWD2_44_7]OGW66192.1 MAG: cell division protein FtsW [Nitrospirae bacterium RIFOXYA2_FULL_44_9]HBG93688.1 putative lipid II flippase FtsW [Nitrospiraceae bacterium]
MNKTYDRWFLLITFFLLGLGALMIYSSTAVVSPAMSKKDVTQFFYFKRHLFTMLLGFAAMFAAYRLRPEALKKTALPLLIFSFLLLVLVFIPGMGISAGGAKRWLRLWPSTFQPSELVKLSMVIFLAKYMSAYNYRTDSFVSFIKPIAIMAVFQVIFLKQPDFGAAISLGIITLAMLFFSGMKLRYLLSMAVFALPVVVKLIREPYRWKRVTSFLNPWDDPQGSGFQLIQSFIALGSGGIKGVGLGESKQKLLFLPETHTDFIFSLVGEELGLIGAGIIILLFVMLFVRGIATTNKAKDSFVYYLSFGLSIMIALQALINFSVVTGMIPTKGLPLPFISYGGSALLVNMAAVGILLNLSKGEDSRRVVDRTKELVMRKKALRAVYGHKH